MWVMNRPRDEAVERPAVGAGDGTERGVGREALPDDGGAEGARTGAGGGSAGRVSLLVAPPRRPEEANLHNIRDLTLRRPAYWVVATNGQR